LLTNFLGRDGRIELALVMGERRGESFCVRVTWRIIRKKTGVRAWTGRCQRGGQSIRRLVRAFPIGIIADWSETVRALVRGSKLPEAGPAFRIRRNRSRPGLSRMRGRLD